jgi:hypothetical protein
MIDSSYATPNIRIPNDRNRYAELRSVGVNEEVQPREIPKLRWPTLLVLIAGSLADDQLILATGYVPE